MFCEKLCCDITIRLVTILKVVYFILLHPVYTIHRTLTA
jgi:hypothetical protein